MLGDIRSAPEVSHMQMGDYNTVESEKSAVKDRQTSEFTKIILKFYATQEKNTEK